MNRTLLLLYTVSEEHLNNLKQIASEWNIVHTRELTIAKELIKDAEVVMGNHNLCESLPFNQQKLKWVQTNSVGIDYILKNCGDHLKNKIVTNAKGVYNDEICEHTIGLVLTLQREFHLIRDAQRDHKWQRPKQLSLLKNKKVMILGYGSLGRSIGEKLAIFGATIFGVNTATKNWKDLLSTIDIIILSLPYTEETRHLFGENEIMQLSENAMVINIGRAETLDEKILFKQLIDKKIRNAAIDVFEDEPLAPDHPAWDIENLFITPHMARSREIDPPFQFENLFEENFKRYINNDSLLNVVDIYKGY